MSKRIRIPESLLRLTYPTAKDVFDGKITHSAGVKKLSIAGVNAGSASDCIYDFKRMMEGAVYHRALNLFTTEMFLDAIARDYGTAALRRACAAVRLHVDYYDGLGNGKLKAIRRALAKRVAGLPPSAELSLVSSLAEIRQNLLTLERYRQSRIGYEVAFYRDLIRLGRCFIVYEVKGAVLFGPSRFVGYAGNSMNAHQENDEKDGRVTNDAIEEILGENFRAESQLETRFDEFCKRTEIQTANRERKFVEAGLSDEEEVVDDLLDIESQREISNTEKRRLVDARVGQGWFRDALLKLWKHCQATGCSDPRMLRASHIKPWKRSDNKERLDPYNGLLLSPNVDQAFDRGLVTFDDEGRVIFSSGLDATDAKSLGIEKKLRLLLHEKNHPYLEFHRRFVFEK